MATSIKEHIIQSEFKGEERREPCKLKGTYTCGGCSYCRYIHIGPSCNLPNGQMFKAWHYVNCKTCSVVYLMLCDCGSFYVGKTNVEFWRRIYRHIRSIQVCDAELPLGRHVAVLHGGQFPRVKFLALDWIHPSLRVGDLNKLLLQRELKWIHLLKATHFPRLK